MLRHTAAIWSRATGYCECGSHPALVSLQENESVQLEAGELRHASFFERMASELDAMLQVSASMEVSEIAQHFRVSAERTVACIRAHLGTRIHGVPCGGRLPNSCADVPNPTTHKTLSQKGPPS